jgi:hypothetical protein
VSISIAEHTMKTDLSVCHVGGFMKTAALTLAAAVCAALGATEPARAGFITFVSGTGNDSNDCLTAATACREFTGAGGALAKTDSGGVIHVLPGEYVAFAINNKSLDIIADSGQASVVNTIIGPISNISGNAGIAITVGTGDVVRLRGFILNAEHGLAIGTGGGTVHVENCTFVEVSNRFGLIYQPTATSELYVRDTTIARENGGSGGGGIRIRPTGSASVKVVLDNVSVNDNASGITFDGTATTGTISALISDSMVSGSTGPGVVVTDSGAGSTNVSIVTTTLSGNTTNGVSTTGANATARVQDSQITGNGRGLQALNGSKLISIGGNMLSGNNVNGSFTATEAAQ